MLSHWINQFFGKTQNQHPIIFMVCYARSGGTLLNRILGSLKNVVILSELNPLGSGAGNPKEKLQNTIQKQAFNWYRYLIFKRDFYKALDELHTKVKKTNRYLILRGWAFVCFYPTKKNFNNPPNTLFVLDDLSDKKIISFALVRDVIDVWISHGKPDLKIFSRAYLNYAKDLKKRKIKIFKYEDLCQKTEKTVRDICKHIGIPFSQEYKKFYKFNKVNGDSQNPNGRYIEKTISLSKRKPLTNSEKSNLINNKYLIQANKLLGY